MTGQPPPSRPSSPAYPGPTKPAAALPPTRSQGTRLGCWLAVLAGLLLLLHYDAALMGWRYALIGDGLKGWGEQVLSGLRDFGQIVPLAVALVIVATYDRRRKVVITSVLAAQLLAAAGYDAGKFAVARDRPYVAAARTLNPAELTPADSRLSWQPGRRSFDTQSFPSGHSASAFAFAGTLAWFYPQVRWLLWTLAAGCAASRYLEAFHWPSDCLAGAALGCAAAWAALRACTRLLALAPRRPAR